MRSRFALPLLLSAVSCAGGSTSHTNALPPEPDPIVDDSEDPAPGAKTVQPIAEPEETPSVTPRLSEVPSLEELRKHVDTWFQGNVGRRLYVQVDKPLYQPGESIWVKVWDLQARTLGAGSGGGLTLELVSPRGSVVTSKRLQQFGLAATNDFELAAGLPGGEYTIRATAFDGVKEERPVIVNTYEAPRIKKTLEFLRKAYGEGDEVTATIEVKRPTGEPLAKKALSAAIRVDGQDLPRVALTTNDEGGGLVRFTLPRGLEAGDGLLTVLVEDGGVTESISKRIPIVTRKLQVGFFPEGGTLIEGLPTRLYFEGKTPLGKPADLEGRIVDDLGNAVATFKSYKNGLGRVAFTPATGRRYHAAISKPVGVTEKYDLPVAIADGCSLRTFDDPEGVAPAIRAEIHCTTAQRVIVAAMLRENLIDVAAVEVTPGSPAIVALTGKDSAMRRAQGVARVTLFDEKLNPLAERLVYRNRRARLNVELTTDRASYSPRDPVSVAVKTTDASGEPISADLALSVVDDTVISYADDKTGHILSRVFLEPELPGKVEEPNFYFDLTDKKSARAMDLLLGTRGYRKFEWQPIFRPAPTKTVNRLASRPMLAAAFDEADKPMEAPKDARAKREQQAPLAAPMAPPPPPPAVAQARPMAKEKADWGLADKKQIAGAGGAMRQMAGGLARFDRAERDMDEAAFVGWAPVRLFPVPQYRTADEPATRTDFRETIFWAPSVHTDASGKAEVKFVTSDAVTSFRIFSEGIGGALVGRNEKVFKSNLPFSLSVKLPLEVSAGDRPMIPITLTNETTRTLDVSLNASFGSLLSLTGTLDKGGALAAGARRSLFAPLEVSGLLGDSEVSIGARTGGLSDDLRRSLKVTPPGFPQVISRSGQLQGTLTEEIDLGEAIPNTVVATLKLYPSPVSTLVSGLDGLLREPSGCFEQTSSTNYPNVMVLQYLKEHEISDPAIMTRSTRLLDVGYHRLSGYESPQKGYEWFGGDPGHEALTAYGLLEFSDMKQVYGDVDTAMIARTASWLKSRRDGQGGYLRDGKALDSFGRASPEVTNAYITYSLVMAGEKGLDRELETQAKLAHSASDPYLLALATATMLRGGHHDEGMAAAKRLAEKQSKTGAWSGADHSITRSGGENLEIETTSLAILALLEAKGFDSQVRDGIAWLADHRGGYGQWGTTQATVLALKAMTTYANASRQTQTAGSVQVLVNGEPAGEISYEAGRRDALLFTDLASKLRSGKNRIELRHDGEALPYSLAVDYRATKPATSPKAVIGLTTSLEKTQLAMGESVRLNAVVTNTTPAGQPMTIARVRFPAGLVAQTWQLKELREKGVIGFFETGPREVTLYFRDMKPSEVKKIPLDLVATFPGHYTGQASSAYLYYNDEHKLWTDGLAVDVKP
jgi:hypothetical protein